MTLSRRHALFAACCFGVTLMFAGTIGALVAHSRQDMTASHLVTIPFVTAVLVFQGRATVFASVETAWRSGAGVMLLGLVLFLIAGREGLTPAAASLVVLWLGSFLLIYGPTAFRAALFPLLFLAFTIPIPAVLLEGAVEVLKRGSTEVVSSLFTLTGTPFHRDGFVFTLPTLAIEIADECSGIRSSIALVLTSLLAGHMFLQHGWTRTLLVIAVLPVTILKNGIRIVGLSLLSIHVDPSFLTGQLHRDGGIVFFLLAIALLLPVFVLLRRSDIARRSIPRH